MESKTKKKKFKQVKISAKMQSMGLDINVTSYSKLEGQIRLATDIEVYTIAKILQVDISELFE